MRSFVLAGLITAASFAQPSAPDAASAVTAATQGLRFIPSSPCRVADTRDPVGPFGGPQLGAATTRSFTVPTSACNIPSTAQAYSLNVAVAPAGPLGYLTVWA